MDRRLKKLYPNTFAYPALSVYGIFFVLPVIAAFVLGFTDWNISRVFSPEFNGLANIIYLFQDEYFILSAKNTAIFAIITTSLKVLIGLLLSLAVNRPLFSKNYLRTIFFLPAILSMVIIGILFFAIFRMEGMLNNFLEIVGLANLQVDWMGNRYTALYCTIVAEIWKWSGFTMAIFLAGLQSIPYDYYEAARIDGVSPFKQFVHITFPLIAPAFSIAFTMNIIGGLKVFEQVYVITNGGPGFYSQVLGTYIFRTFSEGMLGRSTAMGMLLFVGVFAFSALFNSLLRRREVEA